MGKLRHHSFADLTRGGDGYVNKTHIGGTYIWQQVTKPITSHFTILFCYDPRVGKFSLSVYTNI